MTTRTATPRHTRTQILGLAEVRWALTATVLFVVGGVVQVSGMPAWTFWVLYLACYVAGGWEPALEGVRALRNRTLDVDLLMIVAALGAAAIGQIFDGALLIVIFATSGALEAVLNKRTADSIRSLLDLAPEQATKISGGGVETIVDAASLDVGDEVIVRPGERIPGDGVVIEGASEVDQSSVTGEAVPAEKQLCDNVFAGTVNGTGVLTIRITTDPSDTVVARIVAMVEQASSTKAKTQLFIDKVEQYYSTIVVASTLVIFSLPLMFGVELRSALLRAMTFMIVASPCAVVLATMPPLLASMATAGRNGVLVKSAVVMERLRSVSVVALDKTGTITDGSPRVGEVKVCASLSKDSLSVGESKVPADLSEDDILTYAASVERHSEHPVAKAIVDASRNLQPSNNFRSYPGVGVSATVGGARVDVRRPEHPAETLDGLTTAVVCVEGVVVGLIGLADVVRPGSAAAVADLTALTGKAPIMLTGDTFEAARRVASGIGVVDVRAQLLPEDKMRAVDDLQRSGERVLLVGDGVNDAPALASAHTGVSMGRGGSDLAVDTADIVLVRDELGAVADAVRLSRRAHRVVVANLVIAASFIVVLVGWDLLWHLPLPLGVAGHESSTVIVALNGMRLLSQRAWRKRSVDR